MGYELYRQLANRRHRRKRQKAHDQFDQEEDNQSKHILEGKQTNRSFSRQNISSTWILNISEWCSLLLILIVVHKGMSMILFCTYCEVALINSQVLISKKDHLFDIENSQIYINFLVYFIYLFWIWGIPFKKW